MKGGSLEHSGGLIIECLPTCCSEARPARYEPVTQGAWTERQISAIYS